MTIHDKLFSVEQSTTTTSTGSPGSVWQKEDDHVVDILENDEDTTRNLQKGMILILNGVSFYAYLQLSWVVMGQVGAVTHSVCNALRRPVICAAGWILFGGATFEGVVGALLATGGTLGYAHAKRQAAAPGKTDNAISIMGGKDDEAKVQLL